jgi:lipopolysaccharide transport system permease protein
MSFFTSPFLLLWRHRVLLSQTVRNDVRTRFAGSVLGLLWLFLFPLLLLGTYAAIYIYVFKVRFGLFNSNEYVLLIFCGLIPFIGFSDALGTAVSSVTSNASLIKNTLFPIELIPVKAVLVSQCTQVVGMALLLVALGETRIVGKWVLLLPAVWAMQVLFTIGLIWILASLNVYLRDLQNAMSVLILMLMMISPIAYTAEMVPPELRRFLRANPLYYIIMCYQDCLMLNRFPHENVFWVLAAMGLGFFCVGHWFFGRMKNAFIDNV